eukprot:2585544-Ditylum_brightwellii.AAC.1
MVSDVQVEAKLQRIELKRKHSEIIQSWKNEVSVLKKSHSPDILLKQSIIAHQNRDIDRLSK